MHEAGVLIGAVLARGFIEIILLIIVVITIVVLIVIIIRQKIVTIAKKISTQDNRHLFEVTW